MVAGLGLAEMPIPQPQTGAGQARRHCPQNRHRPRPGWGTSMERISSAHGVAGQWSAGVWPCCSIAGAGRDTCRQAEMESWAMGRAGEGLGTAIMAQSSPLGPERPERCWAVQNSAQLLCLLKLSYKSNKISSLDCFIFKHLIL